VNIVRQIDCFGHLTWFSTADRTFVMIELSGKWIYSCWVVDVMQQMLFEGMWLKYTMFTVASQSFLLGIGLCYDKWWYWFIPLKYTHKVCKHLPCWKTGASSRTSWTHCVRLYTWNNFWASCVTGFLFIYLLCDMLCLAYIMLTDRMVLTDAFEHTCHF